ncbi:SDR family NAD(P)-dependent oxidoreductase [Plesiocystis pacifica]|uniref:SDR family NAD(P)-dependent oxidoreductase n=1 Tax=Plesiocystis pacifica TaxID=191768 RepID=UPI0005D47189|nr:SDR family NAD(P)-dependent oxidoreductase [Plesiocystis pacifica]
MSTPTPSAQWRDRVALVTGASSGIGRAIARSLALELGMRVVLSARRVERLEALAAELRDAGAAVFVAPCDLRDEGSILALFAAIADAPGFGPVDVLINNAGLGREAPLSSGATEHWREMLEVNVLGLCICTREAVRGMLERERDAGPDAPAIPGHVIHVASMASHRVPAGSGVYSATKFAVRSLTEGLRLELRAADSKIRVGAVSPGYVETEFAAVYGHGDEERARATYSRFPVLQPEDVAATVAHMLAAPPRVQIHDVLMRGTQQPG